MAYLTLKEFHGEKREFAIDLLWPDRFKKQAQASLRQVLYGLRQISPANPIISASRDEISLGSAIHGSDVWTFNNCVKIKDLDDVEHALSLYRGPFLEGPVIGPEPFQHWAAIQRARLEGKLERSVLTATATHPGQVASEREIGALDNLVRISPMCAQAVLRAMEIDADNGNVAEALQKYEPCLSGCNPHPLYVGCAVIRQARVSEWKLMF